ncbi:MAG: hypothetical protein Unbinned6354contig1000_14 [Prokaryotic dsDNA virus sp.]|nr:MAG: hypothetical protein Unbinned6354contig1000_14 [Prokaryotic dsDNA virus sp.]|tara:strand:+ start:12673 stop:12828 length:156 start_codon:yes stop_codon:yes gene_type:complete
MKYRITANDDKKTAKDFPFVIVLDPEGAAEIMGKASSIIEALMVLRSILKG